MTSKHLFYKLCCEEAKRKAWATALLGLLLFFALPVAIAIVLPSYQPEQYLTMADLLRKRAEWARTMVGFETGYFPVRVILYGAAVVLGLSSFSYLHNKKQTDFYHSLPVKRELLFLVRVCVGFAVPVVLYLIAILISIAIAAVNGVLPMQLLPVAAKGFTGHMLCYGVIYMTTVLASVMTGTRIAAVLGIAVFSLYFPAVGRLIFLYCQTFFDTFYYSRGPLWVMWLCRFSPLMVMSNAAAGGSFLSGGVAAVVVILAFGLVSLGLYRKRPCEAAKKTMAFDWSKEIIKVLLVIAFGLAGAAFFYAIQEGPGWMTFGAVCGTVISHCVIEIVYYGDFKKLFGHEKTMAACMTAVLAIALSFYFDLFRYDTYLPQESQVEQVSVNFGKDGWVCYELSKGIRGDLIDSYYDSYILEKGTVQNIQAVLKIAEEGIRQLEEGAEEGFRQEGTATEEQDRGPECNITVCYTLKSGRKVYRRYSMWAGSVMEEINRIYGEGEYKKVLYPCFGLDVQEVAENMVYREMGNHVQNLSGTPDQWRAVVEAYQEELAGLTMDQRRTEPFAGELLLISSHDNQLIKSYYDNTYYSESYYNSTYPYSWYGWYDGYFYPVYASFTKTIAALSDCGITVGGTCSPDKLRYIQITCYGDYDDDDYVDYDDYDDEIWDPEVEETEEIRYLDDSVYIDENGYYSLDYTDPEKMEEILEVFSCQRTQNKNAVLEAEPDYRITLHFRAVGTEEWTEGYFVKGKVPEYITEAINNARKESGR